MNGLGERRALPWGTLSHRMQILWQLLPAAPDVAITADQLMVGHRAYLERASLTCYPSVVSALGLLEAAGWADRRGDGWMRRTPETA